MPFETLIQTAAKNIRRQKQTLLFILYFLITEDIVIVRKQKLTENKNDIAKHLLVLSHYN